MKYYKIFTDTTFIGIATSYNFLTYQEQNRMLSITDEDSGQFIEYKGKLYRDTWMSRLPEKNYNFTMVTIQNISEEEYNTLQQSIAKDEIIVIDIPEVEPIVIPEPENITLEYIQGAKIREMSAACRNAIYAGFDVALDSSGPSHFSLTEQDQLNIMELNNMINSGMPQLPYHADGEEARFYTPEEAKQITTAASKHRLYHTSYFNCLKQYIQSLETIEEAGAIEYGVAIPEEYQSEVYKMVM